MKKKKKKKSQLKVENRKDYMRRISTKMWNVARSNPWNGKMDLQGQVTIERCKRLDPYTGTSLLFTFDRGYHTCGWWKNPDYDKCFHLSIASLISAYEQAGESTDGIPELTKTVRKLWAKVFFEKMTKLLWVEPPFSEEGKKLETWHYRLFVDKSGIPILPRGEVYSRELTESGWKSWSEIKEYEREMNNAR